MKKDYLKPEAEVISFLADEEVTADGIPGTDLGAGQSGAKLPD